VHALTEQQVRRSFLNCSQGEAKGLTLPKGFADLDWAALDLPGWRDPKAPLRGYLVVETDTGGAIRPVGIAVRAAESRMSARTTVMCLLCQTAQSGDAVSLFTARRSGEAGRNGNTVGTYICADLACSILIRIAPPASDLHPAPEEIIASRAAGLTSRLEAFIAQVLAG